MNSFLTVPRELSKPLLIFTLLGALPVLAGPPPAGWQVAGFGRGGLVTNAIVDYNAGTWNVNTGPARSAIICKSLSGDISVTMKITAASGQTTAHLGIMVWSSLSLTAGKAGLVIDPQGQKLYFAWDEASDRPAIFGNYVQEESVGFPVWLKLTRSGSTFAGYYSKDGREWRPVGVPVKTFWGGKRPEIYAGVYGDGVCEQRFTDLEAIAKAIPPAPPLPDGWSLDLQGQPAFVGDAKFSDGKWTLAGASPVGRGGFHNVTVMQAASPRVQLTAKVRLADLSDPRAAGGLLLNAHGTEAGILAFPAGNKLTFFIRKYGTGQWQQYRNVPIPSQLLGRAEAYLRLALVDARVAAFYGTGPDSWTQVGEVFTANEMTADVTGGMELYTDSSTRMTTSVTFEAFDQQAITALPGQPTPPPPVAAARTPPVPTVNPPPTQSAPAPRPYVPTYTAAQRSSGFSLGGLLCFGSVILAIVVVFLIKPFNRLVYLRNRVSKAWAQIDVQLKRRHDLIGNYVEAVKGYAKHESGTLEGVARARSAAVSATDVGSKAKAEAALNASMRSLYAVVESNPDLKANQNFLSLQGELRQTEDKLAGARNEYNEDVLTYNTQVQSFPTNLIALVFRFKARDFFELKEADQREAPKAAV